MNPIRNGNFTSSEIWKLCTDNKAKNDFGVKGYTYIQEKIYERKLGRSLNPERDSKETIWGKLCEQYLFEKLSLKYTYQSEETLIHPEYNFWCGSPDFLTNTSVGDGKCPYTLKSFCEQIEWCNKGLETFKIEKPEYYWQLVSNAVITGKKEIELILYVPYILDVFEIQNLASNQDVNQNKYAFIHWADPESLPYLLPDKHYKDLNIFKWDLIQSDVDFLTKRVMKASKILLAG